MQNSRTNRAAIFVYSYFLTARHASHYRSHTTIASPLKATPPALAQKSTFLKISLLFIFSLPSPILPREEREMTERTPTQLPANKKCCLLIFAIAIGCLVLADFPASFPPFPFLSAVMLCGVPDNARGVLGCTLRFRPREIPPSTKKIALKAIFICIYAKIIVSLHPQFHAGVSALRY